MVKPHLPLAVCAFLAAIAPAFAQSSLVFQMPGQTGLTTQIVGLGDDNFSRIAGPGNGPAGSSQIVATPSGTRFYILAPGGVFSANAALSSISPLSGISGAASAATVTPDGKYLLVMTDHFYIVNTADNSLAGTDTAVPTGATPVAVSVSHDSKTAWVLSTTTAGSSVTALNLTNLQTIGSPLSLPSTATSMVLSARGFLYVATNSDRLYEINPISLSVTGNGTMEVPGIAGPLQFTPDGNTAYFLNRSSCSTCAPILKLSVPSHTVVGWLPADGSAPPPVDQILVAGNSRVFAYTAALTKLWDITPTPLALTPSVLGNLPTASVVAAAVSNERPSARFLYLLISDHNFYRVNLAINGIDGTTSLDPANGTILSFASIPSQVGATSLFQINPTQSVNPGQTAVITGQFLDPVGRPVFGVPATFSAQPGVSIATPSLVTTAEGFAETVVTAPAATGTYPVTLAGASLSANFQLVVGGGGPSGSSQISIYAGDGQLLRQNETTLETLQPLAVQITDGSGNPLANIAVAFTVTEGLGNVFPAEVTTDANGRASVNFGAGVLQLNVPFLLSKVTASSQFGSVEFFETTQIALSNDPHQPNSEIQTPANQQLTIPQGGFLPAAITARTLSGQTGQGIPNVGLRLTDPVDETAPSTVVACKGLTRGDNNGISRCDVQAFCQPTVFLPHVFIAHIRVGEYKSYPLQVTVTNGSASQLNLISGNNQAGHPGDSFTMFARVTDGCGQPSAVSGLNWAIVQGAASFTQPPPTASDSAGNISARVTLGEVAGPVRVQLSGPGLSPITFNLTTLVTTSGVTLVSGSGQNVVVGQAFPNPVVFVVRDTNNNPISGITVTFSLSGSASLTPGSAVTNAQGLAQTNVTAGVTAGSIVVTATVGSFTATANLSSHLAGPSITGSSFTNAASGSIGMTPCGLVTVSGSGIAPTVQGLVLGVSFFGALPNSLAGVSISVQQNAIVTQVPISRVSNDQAGQRATFQAPCDLIAGTAIVVVTVNGASTTITGVPVVVVQPAIFTNAGAGNKLYGAVIRAVDGSYVSPTNQARQGERLFVVVTGLGQVTPAAITNSAGAGSQNVNLPTLVFLNGKGLGTLSARYLFGSIGSYLVEFQIPADATIGTDQNLLVVALVNNGIDFIVGNTVLLPGVVAANDTGTGGGGTGTGGGGTGTGGGGTGTGGGGTGTGGGGTGTGGGGTGTGGGGTGTGGGGTGTGGGGTGTGGATSPTQDEINSWIARGNYTSGQLSLTRSTAFTTSDNLLGGAPSTTSAKTDSFSGQFTRTSGSDLSKLLNNQLPSGFPVLNPAVGSCVVYNLASLTNPFPNLTTVGLDAGLQLTSIGPNGTLLALRQNNQGVGFYNANNVPNTYLAAGRYALSGPGGADVGVFNGNLDTVADLVVTNPDNFKVISRSGGVTVTWTGGEQSSILTISGSSFTLNLQNGTISGNTFVCIQNVSAGQFTVPASILNQLAASAVTNIGGGISTVARGSFAVTASGKGARFTSPTGLDILTANNSWLWTFTPQYQ